MTQDEARKEIFTIFNGEYLREIGGLDNLDPVWGAFPFYGWLQNNHPEVLAFPDNGDRYQTIASWLGRM